MMYYILQNLITTRIVCLIYFSLCVVIRIVIEVFNSPTQKTSHIDEYDMSNWLSLMIVPIFSIGSVQIIRFFEAD
jgi:hypothetical protein